MRVPAHFFYLDVDVAVVLVKFADLVEILLQLHFIEAAGFIQKGNEGLALRLHLLAQHAFAKMRVSFEMNPADCTFAPSLTV